MHAIAGVLIQEDKEVKKFWQSHPLTLPLRLAYRNWRVQVEKHKNLVPPKAEAIDGLPNHYLYPLSKEKYIFYEVKSIESDSTVFLVSVKQIGVADELLETLLPEIKKQLLQQQSPMKEIAEAKKIGRAIARILQSPQCKAVSMQLLKILLPLFAGISASFMPQPIPEFGDPLPEQKVPAIQQPSLVKPIQTGEADTVRFNA